MDDTRQASDHPVFARTQELVDEEHRLFSKGMHGRSEGADPQRLSKVQVELDQCWIFCGNVGHCGDLEWIPTWLRFVPRRSWRTTNNRKKLDQLKPAS